MYKIIYVFLFFNCTFVFGQSKKKQIIELKSKLNKCYIDKSYIQDELSSVKGKNVKLTNNKLTLENDKTTLKNTISILRSEKVSLRSEKDFFGNKVKSLKLRLSILEKEIEVKQDSIARLLVQMDSLVMGGRDTINSSTDFLNNYFFKRQSLENHKFSFKLDKVLLEQGDYYSKNFYYSVLDVNQFYIAQGRARKGQRLSIKPISFLNTLMPDLQILKNKFLTLTKKNGEVENLLFDLTNFELYRDFFNIQLTPEESKNTKVMNWNLVRIENEIYITFTIDIFHRMLGDSKFNFKERFKIISEYDYKSRGNRKIVGYNEDLFSYYNETSKTFLVRKKNRNLDNDIVVKNPVFLFKLIQQ